MTTTNVAVIATFLDATDRLEVLDGRAPDDIPIAAAAPITEANVGDMAFLTAKAAKATVLTEPGPTLLVLDEGADLGTPALADLHVAAVIRSAQPRLDFMRALTLVAPRRPEAIDPTAVVAASAVIGAHVAIGPNATIGEQCRIGDGSRLEAGVHLYDHVTVGRNVHIHAGAVIGADGFGYERNERGELEQFPHVGRVVIEDNVDIGANTCIDRASLGVTRIRRGAKIDNLVHIGHNADIGEDAVVIALALIGGSTRVGRGAWVSPSACVRDNLDIGDDATIGLGAVVTKDVASGVTVTGSPAREMAEFRALLATWRRLLDDGAPS